VVDETAIGEDRIKADDTPVPHAFRTAAELLGHCQATGLPVSEVMLAYELSWRTEPEVRAGLLRIWQVMQDCVRRGCERTERTLPGGLKVRRRGPELFRTLSSDPFSTDPLRVMDWVNLFALAVNEENASGGRMVTAPTNGAAGIIPAVLHFYTRFLPGASNDEVVRFLLTAGRGDLQADRVDLRRRGRLPGRGRVSLLDGRRGARRGAQWHPAQVENAAEIAMEHNLGPTCDPVGGLGHSV